MTRRSSNIRQDTIDTFFGGRELIVLDGLLFVPGAGDFVGAGGKRFLNVYHEPPMSFRSDAIECPEFELLMEMIVKNLLGHQEGSLIDWIDAAVVDEPSEIKWFFHWIASQYQRPGKALPTALWILGKAQGVGKGLFGNGLTDLLGSANVKHVSSEEFSGDWTDFVDGASFHILDEVDFGSRKEAYDKTKRLIGNDIIAVRKRHLGDYPIPAVTNFLFTTNNLQPLALHEGDRRHTFFETRNTQDAKDRARRFHELGAEGKRRAWEGMAAFLSVIEIDDRLISNAYDTDIKLRMIEGNVEPVDQWFHESGIAEAWPIGHFAPGDWLYAKYSFWAKDRLHPSCATLSYFIRGLMQLVSTGLVSQKDRKRLKDGQRVHGYVRFEPGTFESYDSIAELPVVPERDFGNASPGKAKMITAMREKMQAKNIEVTPEWLN